MRKSGGRKKEKEHAQKKQCKWYGKLENNLYTYGNVGSNIKYRWIDCINISIE